MYWQDNPAFLGQSLEMPSGNAGEALGVGLAVQKAELLQMKASLKDDILRSSGTLPFMATSRVETEMHGNKVSSHVSPSNMTKCWKK